MITDKVLKSGSVSIRIIELSDCNENYHRWLNDEETNRYLETRWKEQTNESILDFVKSVRESNHSYLFAILYENKHVGNIKVGPIHPIYQFGDVSYFIGEKNLWGKGIATKAIGLITEFCFETLKLHKLQASFYEQNIGSKKALLKCGYKEEGIFRKKYKTSDGVWSDIHEYGIFATEYKRISENE